MRPFRALVKSLMNSCPSCWWKSGDTHLMPWGLVGLMGISTRNQREIILEATIRTGFQLVFPCRNFLKPCKKTEKSQSARHFFLSEATCDEVNGVWCRSKKALARPGLARTWRISDEHSRCLVGCLQWPTMTWIFWNIPSGTISSIWKQSRWDKLWETSH